ILIVKNEGLISVGNSTSIDDPFLICQQDFDGKILQTFSAKTHINLEPSVVFENVSTYPTQNGWNIHFPTNDTLMHYNPVKNTLEPVAIFYSQSHVNSNKEFYVAREKYGLNIDKKAFEMPVIVIPEYESEQFYFISIIRYGEQNELPWYFSSRKMALVDKKSNKAYYISLINDFWGDIPFQLQGTSQIWEKCFIQDFPAIEVKKQFGDLLEKNDGKMNESTQLKIEKLVAKTNNEDNSIIFRYTLK
ncbi:MAG: hypothetical protein Q7U86_07710, partial [Draconibacterium sp.]|nr:hypothetical protein [Draconibacterium sp.]